MESSSAQWSWGYLPGDGIHVPAWQWLLPGFGGNGAKSCTSLYKVPLLFQRGISTSSLHACYILQAQCPAESVDTDWLFYNGQPWPSAPIDQRRIPTSLIVPVMYCYLSVFCPYCTIQVILHLYNTSSLSSTFDKGSLTFNLHGLQNSTTIILLGPTQGPRLAAG